MYTLICKLFIKDSTNSDKSNIRRLYGMLSSILGICLNVLLFLGKYAAGILSGSIAITADAFNNLSDAGSSIITLIGFKFSGKKSDPEHPFGHGRIEYLSGLAVSGLIILMGFELAKSSFSKILHPSKVETSILSVVILIVSIGVKLYMYLYNSNTGKKINSAAMKATAIDSISDSIATTVVLISILFLKISGYNIDGLSGMAVALFIIYAGFGAAKDTISPLLGQCPDPDFVKNINDIVMSHDDVIGIHDLIVHDYGPGRIIISLHAEVPGTGNIFDLHDSIDCIEKELSTKLNCEAVIHMDPIAVDDDNVKIHKQKLVTLINEFDDTISIHDFRMVNGPTHTNLIFDAVIPHNYKLSEKETKQKLEELISCHFDNTFAVITIDKKYS